jgi:hypothetical protein
VIGLKAVQWLERNTPRTAAFPGAFNTKDTKKKKKDTLP